MRLMNPLRIPYHRWRQRRLNVHSWDDLAILEAFRGASIALVGNAGYLAQIEQGKRIDEHDLVIRMNNFRINGFEEFVGVKTDIFLTNFYHDIDFSNLHARKAKWIVSSVPNNFRQYRRQKIVNRHGEHITHGLTELGHRQTFSPDLTHFKQWIHQIGKYPTTGAMGILLLTQYLHTWQAKVYLTGFSFFQGPSHYFSKTHVEACNHAPQSERLLVAKLLADDIKSGGIAIDAQMRQHLFAEEHIHCKDAA